MEKKVLFSGETASQDFDFSSAEVLELLRRKPIEFVGTATSDFQSDPFTYDEDGKPLITNDWEYELHKNLEGKESGIQIQQIREDLPNFFTHKQLYVKRSLEIGQNMFRFSLDFGRLCPKEGSFNRALMAEYVKVLAHIKAHGQEPMLTIYHWPMPCFLIKTANDGAIETGGWENPDVIKHYRFYVESVVNYLADETEIRRALVEESFDKKFCDKIIAGGLVQYFISVNEPESVLLPGYLAGVFPPYKKWRMDLIMKVLGRLVEAHDITYHAIKEGLWKMGNPSPKVGVAHAWPYFDGMLGDFAHSLVNNGIANRFERNGEHTDFLAMQYYFRMSVPNFTRNNKLYGEHPKFSDIYPKGILENLKKMHAQYPNKEVFISEFGFSETNDQMRPYLSMETVRYIVEAAKQGVPIKGILLWSMVNNMEWAWGMQQRFGLFDEHQLKVPLQYSDPGSIQGWEAWHAVANAVTKPSVETLKHLQNCYVTAKNQFDNTLVPKSQAS
jgi:beta-glucosidase/6-phospho-beta-glucosidase/beta-galactosidase